jgi:hypothetical protein
MNVHGARENESLPALHDIGMREASVLSHASLLRETRGHGPREFLNDSTRQRKSTPFSIKRAIVAKDTPLAYSVNSFYGIKFRSRSVVSTIR